MLSERVMVLQDAPMRSGGFVLYWMQQSQRAVGNPALQYAIQQANRLHAPVLVLFVVTVRYPEANRRHMQFLLEGLRETCDTLQDMGCGVRIVCGDPVGVVAETSSDAALVVVDRGYMPVQRRWRDELVMRVDTPVHEVEGDVVAPVAHSSTKDEWAAATFRPRFWAAASPFLCSTPDGEPEHRMDETVSVSTWRQIEALIGSDALDQQVPPSPVYRGGYRAARERLELFLETRLERYDELRNDPAVDWQSGLSPYLHFGQISPLEVALAVLRAPQSKGRDAFLEQLLVRRELAMNFAAYNPAPDQWDGLPEWSRRTLLEHAGAPREAIYDADTLEACATHDPYWNSAMLEMKALGKMHGYLRMYWAKRIIEWTPSPVEAFRTVLRLNNRYFLDGRDPNSLCGVAWCFGKHDRPWFGHPVLGKVRYMTAKGLERKVDMKAYRQRVLDTISRHHIPAGG